MEMNPFWKAMKVPYKLKGRPQQTLFERLRHPTKGETKKFLGLVFVGSVLPIYLYVKKSDSTAKYKMSLTRRLSGWYGSLMRVQLYDFIRVPVLRAYAWLTAIDMEESALPLDAFHSIQDLFVRPMKPGLRPLSSCDVVSPCDSRILSYGQVKGSVLESIKGQDYNIAYFLTGNNRIDTTQYVNNLQKNKDNKLYYVTFYLSPADHHRYYSPFDWEVRYRRHLYGYLLGVFPLNLWRRKDIYEVNERVVYIGEWKHGFACFVAVGAYNVGSMEVVIDPELKTNKKVIPSPRDAFEEKKFEPGVAVEKGSEFGRFNTGSTIVLIFEGPEGLQFSLTERGRVKIGEGLLQTTPSKVQT